MKKYIMKTEVNDLLISLNDFKNDLDNIMKTEVNDLLISLNDFKNDLDIELNTDTTVIRNELYRGQKEELNIIIDKVEYILKGESAEWEKIIEILNKVIDSIKEAENLKELIFSIYGDYDSFYDSDYEYPRYTPQYEFQIDQFWIKSDEQERKETEDFWKTQNFSRPEDDIIW
jgi:hypothetical protein